MAQILRYDIVNSIKAKNPIKYEYEVTTQDEIEQHRDKLFKKHRLIRKNKLIDEQNKLSNDKKSKYEILFTIRQKPPYTLTP